MQLFPRNSDGLARFQFFDSARHFLVPGFFNRLMLRIEAIKQGVRQRSALINRKRKRAP